MKRSEIKRRPLADSVLAGLEPDAKEHHEFDGIGRPPLSSPPEVEQGSSGELERSN